MANFIDIVKPYYIYFYILGLNVVPDNVTFGFLSKGLHFLISKLVILIVACLLVVSFLLIYFMINNRSDDPNFTTFRMNIFNLICFSLSYGLIRSNQKVFVELYLKLSCMEIEQDRSKYLRNPLRLLWTLPILFSICQLTFMTTLHYLYCVGNFVYIGFFLIYGIYFVSCYFPYACIAFINTILVLIKHHLVEAKHDISLAKSQFEVLSKCKQAIEKHMEVRDIIKTLNLAISKIFLTTCIIQIIIFALICVLYVNVPEEDKILKIWWAVVNFLVLGASFSALPMCLACISAAVEVEKQVS